MNQKQQALKEKYGDEQVLCIPTEALQAFAEGTDPILYETEKVLSCIAAHGVFHLRWQVELDDTWKQVIPYVLMHTESKVLTAKRLKGDARLVGGYTVGMGGHINPEDGEQRAVNEVLTNCIHRELAEETTFDRNRHLVTYELHPKSFVNVRDEVSKVHLCIPVWMKIKEESSIVIREIEKLQGVWLDRSELPALKGKLEGWSEIALALWQGR